MGDKAATDRSFDITSLKPSNERSNEFQRPPPTSVEEVYSPIRSEESTKQEYNIEELQVVREGISVLRGYNLSFKVELPNEEYLRLGYLDRHTLKKKYDYKYLDKKFDTQFNVGLLEHPRGVT
ncbi:hypothetical protein JCM33374_g6282 [Metschnikowia sp. JCM 33374]|nr:hypothetical protein JCM33374_g6282 [Metschnikowia sp. JCM 33374]